MLARSRTPPGELTPDSAENLSPPLTLPGGATLPESVFDRPRPTSAD
jgi:hypothetical protein